MDASPFAPGDHVAAYLRDSGGGEQELSVAQQEKAVREWTEAHGLLLTHLFVDAGLPGSTAIGREKFQEMIRHFQTPDCAERGVVIWKWNRFARSVDDAQYYRADLRRRGYVIHSLNDAIPEGPEGRLFEAAVDWMNTRFLDDMSADVSRGLRFNFTTHGVVPGNPPRGFKREEVQLGRKRNGELRTGARWVPDPDLVDVVRQAFEMRAAGATLRQINEATQLYSSKNGWPTFFRNRLYMGEMRYSGIVVPNYCQPIVSAELWEAANAVGKRRGIGGRGENPRRLASSFLLSGLVYCQLCGGPTFGHVIQMAKNKTGYDYYACSRHYRSHDCRARSIPASALEKAVSEQLVLNVLQPDQLAGMQDLLTEQYDKANRSIRTERSRLEIQRERLRRRVNNLVNAISEQGGSAALLEKLRHSESDLRTVETRLVQLRESQTPELRDVTALQAISARMIETLRAGPDEDRRQLFRLLLTRVTAVREGAQIYGEIFFIPPLWDGPSAPIEGRSEHIKNLLFTAPAKLPG